MKRNVLLLIGSVAVIAVVGIFLGTTRKEKVDLKEYINVQPEIKGFNGKASIEKSTLFDEGAVRTYLHSGVEEDLADMKNTSDEELVLRTAEYMVECEQAVEDMKVTVWKDGTEVQELTELSNGTVVKVEVSSINPENEYLNKTFKTGTAEFTVEGLDDGQEIDVFAETEMEVSFSGVDGDGHMNIDWSREMLPEVCLDFYVEDGYDGYSNGDEVELIMDYDIDEWTEKGYYPKETSWIYTVEGLSAPAVEE